MDDSDAVSSESSADGKTSHSQIWRNCCRGIIWVKYTLFTINFLISVCGLCMLILGIWVRSERLKLGPLDNMTTDPAYMLIALGSVMFVITIPGYMGALRESLLLLKMFCVTTALTFVTEVICGVVAFAFLEHIRLNLLTNFHQSLVIYQDDPDVQGAVDYIQQHYKCCGTSSYQDWESNVYFNCSSPAQSRCGVPMSCCKSFHGNTHCGYHTRKLQEGLAGELVFTKGCIFPLIGAFRDNLTVVGLVAFGIGLMELVSIVLANIMMRDIALRGIRQAYETTHINMQGKSYDTMENSMDTSG